MSQYCAATPQNIFMSCQVSNELRNNMQRLTQQSQQAYQIAQQMHQQACHIQHSISDRVGCGTGAGDYGAFGGPGGGGGYGDVSAGAGALLGGLFGMGLGQGMMGMPALLPDGTIDAIRSALSELGFSDTGFRSYSSDKFFIQLDFVSDSVLIKIYNGNITGDSRAIIIPFDAIDTVKECVAAQMAAFAMGVKNV